jgi:serine/threonine protein kinase/WD40 repeat protein
LASHRKDLDEMNSEESRVEAIFFEALDQPSSEDLNSFLVRACENNDGLRRRVEALLGARDKLGGFLQSQAPNPTVTMAPAAPPDRGARIGPYKLLQKIGEGGMGVVWMAEQIEPVQRKVALKLIKPGMDSGQFIARFEAERQALAMMDHVNIARVLDAGATEAGRPYFVMELVHGIPITKYCDDNRLTPRQRLELFVPVCRAIQHAHQKGIIHRDIKPSNVMITLYDGQPIAKVIDFGVAKATEQNLTERTLFTQYGSLVGTLEYMSPEQAETSALGVDTRSDIYSLGVLLYELLTGSTPLSGKRLKEAAYGEILRMIKEEEPPRPSTRLNDSGEALASISAQRHTEPAKLSKLVRGELDWIVMKTLEKDRNRRYETANGVAADVQRYLDDEPVQACPPSAGYRFRKFARRNQRLLATACLLTVALAIGAVVSTWQAIRATHAERLANGNYRFAETQKSKAQHQLVLTKRTQAQSLRRLYDARLSQAQTGVVSRRVGQRFDSLNALAEATKLSRKLKLPTKNDLPLRNAAIAALALTDIRLRKLTPLWPKGSCFVDFDENLVRYARCNLQGAVSIRRVADDASIAELPALGVSSAVNLSNDGQMVLVWSEKGMQIWSLNAPEPVRVLNIEAGVLVGADICPNGRQAVVSHADGAVVVHDLVSGKPPRRLPDGVAGDQIIVAPDNRRFAISYDAIVEIRDLDSGQVLATLQHDATVHDRVWHPAGKIIAVACADLMIHLWDTATGKEILTLDGFKNSGIMPAFSHDGDMLANFSWEGKLRLWDARTGKQLFSTPAHFYGAPRFSADNRFLGGDVRDGKLALWEIAASREYQTLAQTSMPNGELYFNPSVHRDGKLLAVGMYGGVGLWDLQNGRELGFLEAPGVNFICFESSGTLLANSPEGLLRWPIESNSTAPGELRIGPPEKLSIPGSDYDVACSGDGRVIASAQSDGGVMLRSSRPDQPIELGPQYDTRYVSVSHDGKLVATGSHSGDTNIWSTDTGELLKNLPSVGWRIGFSPDGQWLGTVSGGFRLWEVGTWKEGPTIGGGEGFAFSPDGAILAVESGAGSIRLVDPDTGKEYARLEDPNQDRARHITFSPDGTRLIATNDDSLSIHVWDLRMIRDKLAKMDLDWALPEYEPPRVRDDSPLSIEIAVDAGEGPQS